MSYEPTNWKTGDVVTSAKLNKLEQGVASGGGMVVTMTFASDTGKHSLDKNYKEISEAVQSGIMPVFIEQTAETLYGVFSLSLFGFHNGAYAVALLMFDETVTQLVFTADSETGVLQTDGTE